MLGYLITHLIIKRQFHNPEAGAHFERQEMTRAWQSPTHFNTFSFLEKSRCPLPDGGKSILCQVSQSAAGVILPCGRPGGLVVSAGQVPSPFYVVCVLCVVLSVSGPPSVLRSNAFRTKSRTCEPFSRRLLSDTQRCNRSLARF